MNKIYRIVFNQATQTWTAVAENARAKGKSGRATVGSSKLTTLVGASAISAAALLSVQAMAEDTYFHMNTGDPAQPTGDAFLNKGTVDAKGGATGQLSLAVGLGAGATGTQSLAAGFKAKATQGDAIAIGTDAQALSRGSISIGRAAGHWFSAEQLNAEDRADTIIIGDNAGYNAKGRGSILFGFASGINRKGDMLNAQGRYAGANFRFAEDVLGPNSEPFYPAALYLQTKDFADQSLNMSEAIGVHAGVNARGALNSYIGSQSGSKHFGNYNVAMGFNAGAGERLEKDALSNYDAVRVSESLSSVGNLNVSLGQFAAYGLNGDSNIAIGTKANHYKNFDEKNQTVRPSGTGTYAYVNDTISLGVESTAQKDTAVAIGKGAKAATAEGDVALGAGSVTRAVTPTSSATINNVTYGTFAGAEPTSAVSVGAVGSERQIQNVAAGRITADSTDAINGSQLYAVASELGGEVSNTYFHVNTGTNRNTGNATTNLGSITDAAGATGEGAVTAGVNAQAKGSGSLALGQDSYAVSKEAVAIGMQAGTDATMADRTVMIGSQAGISSNTTNSVLLGWQSAYNRVGSGLVAIGTNAAGASTPSDYENSLTSSVAIGESAAVDASGMWNSYIGTMAGSYKKGENNVGIGYYAGAGEIGSSGKKTIEGDTGSIGSNNVSFGYFAGSGVDGDDNIAIGQWANTGAKPDGGFIGFNDTVALGRDTVANLDSNVAIGAEANAAAAKGDVALGAGSATRKVTPTSSATVNGITYGTFAGAKPESAVSVGEVGKERQIQNVAAGQISATSTDAINGSQLYAVADKLTAVDTAANRINYFHVNTGVAGQAAGNATTNEGTVDAKGGATATGAIAAGVNATATAGNTIAIGQGANSAHANSVVIGAEAKSSSLMGYSQATAVGYQANAGNDSVAIGSGAVATGATTTTTHSGWATAVGRAAQATGLGSVAMGNEANASHIGTVAVGPRAAASAREAAAFGGTSTASGYASLAAGYRSNASGALSSAYGSQSTATGTLSTANGYSADATGTRSTSIGSESQATANFATALGDSAWATAANSTALGTGARSTGAASLAVGSAAQTQAFQSVAFGNGASVYAGGTQALALGANATTSDANAVALGSGARTTAAVGTTEATVNGIAYDGFAGTAPIATVSVGNDTQKRTITNVAAGRITADSTDAINGSQLYAVADKLTADIKAADTNTVTTVTAGKNITVKNIGTKDAPNYQVATADEVAFDKVTVGPVVISKDTGIDAGNTKITNVAAGVADTDAVNVKQLNDAITNINTNISAAKTEVAAGDNVTVETGAGENGQTVYTVSAKDTSASVSAGSSAVSVTKGVTSKVGTTDVTDYAVDLSQATKDDIQKGVDANTAVNNKGLTFAGDSGSTDVQKLGSTVGVKGDSNITTSASGSQVNVSLNKNLDLGDDGSITTGNTVVNNDGISITNGANQTVSLTNNGLNNGGNRITNVAPGVDATDAVNVSQLTNATNSIYSRIDDLDKDYRAGVAGNAAMMNIPQVTRPGANLLGIGLGHHKGESAVAVGFSSSSDNEQLIFKMSGSANTQGDFTIGSGLGWQW